MPLPLQVLILENVRFYKEETKNDPEFAKKVGWPPCAGLSDIMSKLVGAVPPWSAQVTRPAASAPIGRQVHRQVPCPGAPGRLYPV